MFFVEPERLFSDPYQVCYNPNRIKGHILFVFPGNFLFQLYLFHCFAFITTVKESLDVNIKIPFTKFIKLFIYNSGATDPEIALSESD